MSETIGNLLNELTPFVDGAGSRPTLFVNGRLTNPSEITGFPPEALERVEVLPRGAAAQLGGDPSARVINLVLKREFKMLVGEIQSSWPTAGGRSAQALSARRSSVEGDQRSSLDARLGTESALRASERDLSEPDLGSADRTLLPAAQEASANLAMSGPVGEWSVSGNVRARMSRRLQTEVTSGDVKQRDESVGVAITASGLLDDWLTNIGLDGQVAGSSINRSTTDGDLARSSRTHSLTVRADARKAVANLPAGSVQANLSATFLATGNEDAGGRSASTEQAQLQLGVVAPLAASNTRDSAIPHPSGGVLAMGAVTFAIPDSGNINAGFNGSVSWQPMPRLNLSSSFSYLNTQPTNEELAGAVSETYNHPVYDFVAGETVSVVYITGGNSGLRSGSRHSLALNGAVGPFEFWRSSGNLSYERTVSINTVGSLPTLSLAVEAAFPDRYIRNSSGRLLEVDARAINIERESAEVIRGAVSVSIPLAELRPEDGPNAREKRLDINLSHIWQLSNFTVIGRDLPEVDRLAGDAGGAARHQSRVNLRTRLGRLGVGVAGTWQGPVRIRREIGRSGPDDLLIRPLAKVDLKLTYTIGNRRALAENRGPANGLRFTLDAQNLFDARPKARLGDGRPARGYSRADQDPLGRVIRIAVSKPF